jgi:hypothetical protein
MYSSSAQLAQARVNPSACSYIVFLGMALIKAMQSVSFPPKMKFLDETCVEEVLIK